MAQRRSRNRRLSARRSNVSGFLNDDTNVFDNDDPLWFERTAIRPSTSLRFSQRASDVLDPDSTIHASQMSDNWFENLSQTENSKQMHEAVKKNASKRNEETRDSDRVSAATESESEHEFQKKRANLRAVRKPNNKSTDKSNAFLKALEKTTESHTRNLTHAQMLEGNESESTHDDSKTIVKTRPRFARRAKNDTNNFDKALESDSASERVEPSHISMRSSKRISEANEDFVTPAKQQRLTRSTAEKIAEVSHGTKSVEKLQSKSVNKSVDKSVAESSARELRNRSVTIPAKPATPSGSTRNSSSAKKRYDMDRSADASSSSLEVKKQKSQIFSRGNKSTAEKSKENKSAFEAALDSVNASQESEATLTEAVDTSKRTEEPDNAQEEENEDSDSSSIPQNIRRTRSYSIFGKRTSGEAGDVNSSKRKSRAQEIDASKSATQSLDESTANQSSASNKEETSRTNLTIVESSDDEEIYNVSHTRSNAEKSKNSSKAEATKSQVSSVESTDSEDMVDESPVKADKSQKSQRDKTESTQLRVSSIDTSYDEDMIEPSPSKTETKEANASMRSTRSSVHVNKSKASKSTSNVDKNVDVTTSSEVSKHKSRLHLLPQKNVSREENPFEQISFSENSIVHNKSKEKEIDDTPKLSQRSPRATNKSHKNQSVNTSKNKSNSRENSKNNSKADESEDETSTIPTNIRRTRSRLFQRSKIIDDVFENVSDAENMPHNQSTVSQKSRTSNKSISKSASTVRDNPVQKSILGIMKNKPRVIREEVIQHPGKAAGSPKQNQENEIISGSKNLSAFTEKPVHNSPVENLPSEQRSVETSTDGTPAPMSPKDASTPFPPMGAPTALPSKRISSKPTPAKSAQNSAFDDLLSTPNPAQSTLNPHGKPVDRITRFSFITLGGLERTPQSAAKPPVATVPDVPEEGDEDLDVTGDSEVSDNPLLTRHLKDIPDDKEETSIIGVQGLPDVVSKSPKKNSQGAQQKKAMVNHNNNEAGIPIDWDKVKKHTDAVKLMVNAQQRLAEETRRKRELEKERIDKKFNRLKAQKAADLKRKNQKPIHKAFLVDGKVYKQPKLPRPKRWVTDKLYNHLQKCMKPIFGERTRVKSEEFVVLLSDFETRISKRKKFENYSAELDEIMLTMARLGIIETRYDFYRFNSDFMPSSFIEKVNPMMLPGNKRNIPFDPATVSAPLLNRRQRQHESDTEES